MEFGDVVQNLVCTNVSLSPYSIPTDLNSIPLTIVHYIIPSYKTINPIAGTWDIEAVQLGVRLTRFRLKDLNRRDSDLQPSICSKDSRTC